MSSSTDELLHAETAYHKTWDFLQLDFWDLWDLWELQMIGDEAMGAEWLEGCGTFFVHLLIKQLSLAISTSEERSDSLYGR